MGQVSLGCGGEAPDPARDSAGQTRDSAGSSAGRPNVLLVVVDTLRADRMPFHGYARAQAPFLAELAEQSVVFEAAWSSSSWTAPSTASIFTSLYPYQHGVTMGIGIYGQLREGESEELV